MKWGEERRVHYRCAFPMGKVVEITFRLPILKRERGAALSRAGGAVYTIDRAAVSLLAGPDWTVRVSAYVSYAGAFNQQSELLCWHWHIRV